MNAVVPIALIGWIPVVLFLFAVLPARRAVLAAFLVAWLFLPMAGYKISGLPDYTKMSATCAGVLLATLLFDPARLLALRPHWADLPMAVWCLVPLASSLDNGLGAYDGVSATVNQTVTWGVPYLIGRMYFSDWDGLRTLAVAIFIGGLIYVPFCLYEIRMSPQLHRLVYGFHQHSFLQTRRFDGWRPMVFMQHGLMVGMWMTAATLLGLWLWRTGALQRLGHWSLALLVPVQLVTTVLCKSAGALALLLLGITVLYSTARLRSGVLVLALAAAPLGYMLARTVGGWEARNLVSLARDTMGEERARSLQSRLDNERMLADKALRRPVWGWGGWGRNRVYDMDTGADMSITDGYWVIALGVHGIVGLAAITGVLVLPAVRLLLLCRARHWGHPSVAGGTALAVLLLLYAGDSIFNAMINPVFLLAAGGLCGLRTRVVAASPAPRVRRVQVAPQAAAAAVPGLTS